MSDRPDQSIPECLSALDDLLVQLVKVGQPGTQAWQVRAYTVSRLQKKFARAGCIPLADWLAGRAQLTPADLTNEIEAAAPHCVIAALPRIPHYELCLTDAQRDQGLELNALHRRAICAAQSRLNELADVTGAGAADGLSAPFLDFPKLRQRLLRAVYGKGKVPRDTVLKAVYPKRLVNKANLATLRKLVNRTTEELATKKELTDRGIRLEVTFRGKAVWLADISTGEPWTARGQI